MDVEYEKGNKKGHCPHCYFLFGFSNWHDIRFFGLPVSRLDRNSDFGLISSYCVAAGGTSGGGRCSVGQAAMDNALFPSKDGWNFSRYPAFLERCFWLCWSVCWSGSLSIRQDAAGCSLRQLLHLGLHRLLAIDWLWSACSDRPAY